MLDQQTYDLISRRAAYPIYLRYKVNRFELWLLSALSGYLDYEGQDICSKGEFFRNITGHARDYPKFEGYYQGLLRLQLIGTYEYISKPGSLSIGLSQLGAKVLEDYKASVKELHARYRKQYKIDQPISFVSEHPRYIAKSA